METNETIATKGVVSLNDRKLVGKVKGLAVDCESCRISHYIVSSSSTNTDLALPIDKALAVGDTFMTIRRRGDFLGTADSAARAVLNDDFNLVGLDVYSHGGNHLGVVKGFDIDTTFGKIVAISLENGESYERDSFVFFAREFVFVDDGSPTDADLRAIDESDCEEEDGGQAAADPKSVDSARQEDEPAASRAEQDDVEAAPEQDDADADWEQDDPDAELKEFLMGRTLNERVESKDGEFTADRGERLDREVLDAAQRHDALLLLTLSVDE